MQAIAGRAKAECHAVRHGSNHKAGAAPVTRWGATTPSSAAAISFLTAAATSDSDEQLDSSELSEEAWRQWLDGDANDARWEEHSEL